MTERIQFTDRAEWLKARQSRVGASEVAALFDCQADYQLSRFALWQVKSGRIPSPDAGNERTAWGIMLEEAIAAGAAERNRWTIERGGYVEHPTVRGMGCSLDFVVIGGSNPSMKEGPGALEIKNVDWMIHKRQWENDEPPIHISLQLQHQLACTGYEWGAIVALVGGNKLTEPYYFERRPRIIAEIEKRVAEFWRSIEEGREPPPDGSDTTAAAIAALFPEAEPGKTADMDGDNEFPNRWAALIQAKADRQAAEKAEAAAKNWLMEKIEDAELVRYGGKIIATAKTQTRKSYTVKESSSRVLRIKEN